MDWRFLDSVFPWPDTAEKRPSFNLFEVVTKVQRVEVESTEAQTALKDSDAKNAQLQLQLEALQEESRQAALAAASLQQDASREETARQGQITNLNLKVRTGTS